MSRLGDLILLERSRQKLTRKQVARKCGVSESYLKDVEEGRRIIQDDQARRILKTLGTSQRNEAEFSLDEIAATVDLSTLAPKPVAPAPQPKPAEPKPAVRQQTSEEQSGIWLDALSSVLKPVPVMNAGWIQVSRRMVPIQDGKIEGAKPDKVVYFLAPDDSMRAMRIEKGDLVLIVPQTLPIDGAIMLVEYGAHRCLRRIKLLGNSNILLQSGDRELGAESVHISDVKLVGKAVRVEIVL
ncbi:MAG: XRE family transcriptional regulator [Clostridia bacterium]|nr:XRE family transcriptional regulator [Clostridia bacterium]MBQ6859325.1 XRE family transcriptional regulator [Clostridia bacterium]